MELLAGELLDLVALLLVVLPLLLGLLDLSLLLGVNSQDFDSRVLVKHLKHHMGELDRVVKDRGVVLFRIEVRQSVLGDNAEIVIEDVSLQNSGILLVLLV